MRPMILLLLVAACSSSPKREELTPAQLAAQRQVFMTRVEATRAEIIRATIERMEMESEGGKRSTFDILIVHGGRDYGAFGAGYLVGWGEVEGELARPRFDLVTGVSSGALLAPFAVLDDDAQYRHVLELHRNPDPNWVKTRGLFYFWPGYDSTYDPSGLYAKVREVMSLDLAAGLAKQRERSRQLLIGTTNIDHGAIRIWDLGREAQKAVLANNVDRFHSIVIASLSLPVVFPPVEIDDDLYVDGATTAQLFLGLDVEEMAEVIFTFQEKHPDRPLPKFRIWVIINGKLSAHSDTTQPRWIGIGVRALMVMLDSGRVATLRSFPMLTRLMNTVPGLEAEFRFVSIPEDWKDPADAMALFDRKRMRTLADLGYRMGADVRSWKTQVPSSRWPSDMPREEE